MKEYFFLKGKTQNGPFTIEQLSNKEITSETFVWTEGMENWEKLKDIPELAQVFKRRNVPPPPPIDKEENVPKTEIYGQLKVTTEKSPNQALEAIKPNKLALTWLIIWCVLNLFALLMSYSGVKYFSNGRTPKTSEFWPFVTYRDCYYVDKSLCDISIFNNYDWSEFALYVGGVLVIYLLIRLSNKPVKNKNLIA